MIVARLLTVRVQPVFVLLDTDTLEPIPGPVVEPTDLRAAQLGQLPELIEQARQQIDAQIAAAPTGPTD